MKLPAWDSGSYTDNSPVSDYLYINNHDSIIDPDYWNQTTNWGTETWHNNWISGVINGNAGGTNFYSKLAAWYLMDEAYNPDWYRDAASNQFSVSGHSSFCSAQEPGNDYRPKMTGPGAMSVANTYYTAMSGAIDILCGNDYGAGSSSKLWYTPNMVAWMYGKISNETRKMVIPWLWGLYENITYSKYVFYGSLIEGARGILWWRRDVTNSAHYSVYAHQSNIYNMFTASASFNGTDRQSDKTIFMSGADLSATNDTQTHNFSFDTAALHYPLALTRKCSIKAFSYVSGVNTRWRIYVVNHTPDQVTLTARFASAPPNATAYKRNTSDYVTIDYVGGGAYGFTDTLAANACQFYDAG